MRAWELHEQGWKQKDIAAAFDGSSGAMSQWFKKAKAQGVEALRHQLPPGRQAQLSPEQMAQCQVSVFFDKAWFILTLNHA